MANFVIIKYQTTQNTWPTLEKQKFLKKTFP